MSILGESRIEFYWEEHYSSYEEAKRCGGLRSVSHDQLVDGEQLHFNCGIAADIVEWVRLGADMVSHKTPITFLLFNANGQLVDVI